MASPLSTEVLLRIAGNRKIYECVAAGQPPLVAAFWKYLLFCFETPRPSTDYMEPDDPKRLDEIRSAVTAVASQLGAEVSEEPGGSLLMRRDGRGAGAGKPWLCLQGHLDMVCSQNEGVVHDFERDSIEVRLSGDEGMEDGWLKALKATTLGADNGVAIAACLAVLEVLDEHPPLEVLLTANEETNFAGAEGLRPGTLRAKRLLNLDSEEEYSICVGCAGGFEHSYRLPVEREACEGLSAVAVTLSGLRGGHSGVDIHKGHGNANKLLARLLLQAAEPAARLLELSGGTGPSAIPREASCVLLLPPDRFESFCEALDVAFAELRTELGSLEPAVELSAGWCGQCEPVDTTAWAPSAIKCFKCQLVEPEGKRLPAPQSNRPLTRTSTAKVWQFCTNVSHGVLSMSSAVPGLVESSVSFGMLELREDHLFCHLFLRSSSSSYLGHGQRMLSALGQLCGAKNVENQVPFPAWQPRMDSPLLSLLKSTHMDMCEKEPRVYAIHAGLECGIFMLSHPDLDCCSIGPWICNAHSPDERINIASGHRYVLWLQRVLESLAVGGA